MNKIQNFYLKGTETRGRWLMIATAALFFGPGLGLPLGVWAFSALKRSAGVI